MEINFTVRGEPKALKRHRTATIAGKKIRYDPSLQDKKDFIAIAQKNAPKKLFINAVTIDIYAYFGRPKNHFRTGKFAGQLKKDYPIMHTKKPDVDNLLKFVLDCLTGVYFKDDAQVYKTTTVKLYDHEKPRIEVFVKQV